MGADTVVDVEDSECPKPISKTCLPKPLSLEEKKYLLAVERGDMANVRRMLQKAHRHNHINIDCVDSLGRGALTLAIDGENLEMAELLVIMDVQTKDALLHAINAEFVEAVELLLEHEELIHKEDEPYSWQKVDLSTATFTPDITPLILAAHKNNYEILKILLDRGATIPMPHDIKCGCDDCIRESKEDSLRQALSRLNEYRALASPSLIALSSSDPILTAFQLSWELRNLAFAEPECRSEYLELRRQCQQFAVDLLHQSRSSEELAIILNHDPESLPYQQGDHMKLARLELAITYKQKKFVAHPNIQQLLASMWYEGVPGFRRKTTVEKLVILLTTALFFPLYCTLYMLAPHTKTGKLMRKPFMKFLIHASSYLFFLLILILVSQRAEDLLIEIFGTESMKAERFEKQRGKPPALLEYLVLLYVMGFIYEETYEIYVEGMKSYLRNLWNSIDFTRNFLYCLVFLLRVAAYIQQQNEIAQDPSTAYIPREKWNAFDPQLIAEGLFAAANIFSALKLVHLFSINPHLGPLQISLGRMVIDIVKFFFIYSLVLFAFACGLNQLLWYFSDLERKKCYVLPNGEPDWDNRSDSCMKWRSFANVFESSQSLFWASFGMVDLGNFELTGIKTYTRFWGLLMFGSYSVINVIVLLNLLIAMMSNSYAMIDEHSDTEWKFARTKLWMSYFEEGNTLPPPFNIFPTLKTFLKTFKLRKKDKLKRLSTIRRNHEEKERDFRYTSIMRALVWRYVSAVHKKCEEDAVTEDDINEVKGDISAFRYDILEVLNKNGMDISSVETKEKTVLGKKMKVWERRLMKDFKVAPVVLDEEIDQLIYEPPPENEDALSRFRRVAKLAALNSNLHKWGQVVTGACLASSQIGHCNSSDSFKTQQNLLKAMEEARRFVARSPLPASRSSSPIELPDTTGQSIMDILKDVESPDEHKAASTAIKVLSSLKTPLQPNVLIKKQPEILISLASQEKENNDYQMTKTKITDSSKCQDVPDFISLDSLPGSPKSKPSESQVPPVNSQSLDPAKSQSEENQKPESKLTENKTGPALEKKPIQTKPDPQVNEVKSEFKVAEIKSELNLDTKPETNASKVESVEGDKSAGVKLEQSVDAKPEPKIAEVKPGSKIVDEKEKSVENEKDEKPVDAKPESKVAEENPKEKKNDAKLTEVKTEPGIVGGKVEPEIAEKKPVENKTEAESKIVEEKPVESKTKAESKIVEEKPAESKTKAESKIVEEKPAESKTEAESKIVEEKPVESKTEAKPVENKTEPKSDNQPIISKPEENKKEDDSATNASTEQQKPDKNILPKQETEEPIKDTKASSDKTESPPKLKGHKGQAPSVPNNQTMATSSTSTETLNTAEKTKSPLSSRSISRVGDLSKKQKPRTGWL